jgi:hypothetical protein
MGAAAEVEKERSAIENDFGVKSVYSPADGLAAKANRRASVSGEDRDWGLTWVTGADLFRQMRPRVALAGETFRTLGVWIRQESWR